MSEEETSPLNVFNRFTLSDEELEDLQDAKWLIPNLVIAGHLIVIAAEPNAGKTTIFRQLAGDMSENGNKVLYINADIAASNVKEAQIHAKRNGYDLLLPDFKAGESMNSVGQELVKLSESDAKLHDTVLIIDTLKKLIDLLNKSHLKELLSILRRLTAKGMTVILLAHTNKHKDSEGNPVFEGTGDLRADVDELIYLIPHKNQDNSMVVTTKPDKVRGDLKPLTFNISPDREVTLSEDSISAQTLARVNEELRADAEAIAEIEKVLAKGTTNQKDIVDACSKAGIPVRTVKSILSKYDGSDDELPLKWNKSRGQGKTLCYSLEP